MRFALLAALAPIAALACNGTTGYDLVTFYAVARGPADAKPGTAFAADKGFTVTLDEATLRVAAIYLNESQPTSGAAAQGCTLPGTYVGEVRPNEPFVIDMLSPEEQLFPITADGSTIPSVIGQVWLGASSMVDDSDPLAVLHLVGTAARGGSSYPFKADLTINKNRQSAPASSALPGEHPICIDRIVTPIPAALTLAQSGTLVLALDPRVLFTNVDFSSLPVLSRSGSTTTYAFTNDDTNQASLNLYANLRAASAAYRFEWRNP
jgi:hypothetical protein